MEEWQENFINRLRDWLSKNLKDDFGDGRDEKSNYTIHRFESKKADKQQWGLHVTRYTDDRNKFVVELAVEKLEKSGKYDMASVYCFEAETTNDFEVFVTTNKIKSFKNSFTAIIRGVDGRRRETGRYNNMGDLFTQRLEGDFMRELSRIVEGTGI